MESLKSQRTPPFQPLEPTDLGAWGGVEGGVPRWCRTPNGMQGRPSWDFTSTIITCFGEESKAINGVGART